MIKFCRVLRSEMKATVLNFLEITVVAVSASWIKLILNQQ